MQKRTRSILEELDSIHEQHHAERDKRYIIESRAQNVLASAIRLVEQIESTFPPEQAENLVRKFLNSIRSKDISKFVRTVRKGDKNEN